MNRETLLADLTPFVDIGQSVPRISQEGGVLTAKMVRDGYPLKIAVDLESGRVQTSLGKGAARNHASLAAMFASPLFGDLRRWADAQAELLRRDATPTELLIPVNGLVNNSRRIHSIEEVDLLPASSREEDATEIILIDGPAGIGKTNLIEQWTLRRADGYKNSPQPLILHVKSRGRILSNLQDLLAFSLQTVRTAITYDQVPVLAKYGLVTIAIDGFDELGDPNGYELAWAQVADLVSYVRGKGTLILAGRDTFVGRQRLLRDVTSLRESIDIVTSLTLELPTATQAKDWLKRNGWKDADFELPSVSVLLEDRSFALRPVFLQLLREYVTPSELAGKDERYLTPLLVRFMVQREAPLFGKAVKDVLSLKGLEAFLMNYMREVAREMADSQTEALDTTSLMWIAEAALGDGHAEIASLVKNRACVVGFLINDERPGYRRFIHTHLLNYFLAGVTLDALSVGDVPKFIRRNILGTEYLSIFGDVVSDEAVNRPESVKRFLDRTINFPHSYQHADRAIRNVGALILATLPAVALDEPPTISNFQIDDAVVTGTSMPAKVVDVQTSQLDCRGADLRSVAFGGASSIVTLIANDSSLFSTTFPIPKVVLLESGAQMSDPVEIENWLKLHGRNEAQSVTVGISSSTLKQHSIYRLLGQACRVRQYWLREEDELLGRKIMKHDFWPILRDTLRSHQYLREEVRQASGRSSVFVHIKDKDRILAEATGDAELAKFFAALERAVSH